MGKLKNGKAVGNDEVTGEMIKGGGEGTGWWTGFGGCVIWLLGVVVCQNGDLL